MSRSSIANNALRHIKNSKTVTDVDTDTSTQAVVLQAFIDIVFSEIGRKYEWPPLKKIDDLALVEEDPNDEWGFSYTYPADCLKPRYIVDGSMDPSAVSPRIAFEEGADGSNKLIFTDAEEATLCYTKAVTDVTIMSDKWRSAAEYLLASKIAPTLAGEDRTGMGQRCFAMYLQLVDEAWAEYLNTRKRISPPESEFIEGR